jgi:ABC-type branched-subunit amino acid transport system ATPase component
VSGAGRPPRPPDPGGCCGPPGRGRWRAQVGPQRRTGARRSAAFTTGNAAGLALTIGRGGDRLAPEARGPEGRSTPRDRGAGGAVPADEPILTARGVSKRFGGVQALDGVELAVLPGRVTGVIGPNGSGKSTLFNAITGLVRADAGTITFRGDEITDLSPDRINRLGIARSFQLTRLFGTLSAFENLVVVARGEREAAHRRADELLDLLTLTPVRDEYAANLSYGQQKLLEFARLMMNDPSLLLLDEPFAGVNPVLEQRLLEQIAGWVAEGRTVLLTDHEMGIMMELCQELVVLDHGQVIARGSPAEVRADERVMEAYFGR